MSIGAQSYSLSQILHVAQVIHPLGVDHVQQDHALQLAQLLSPNRRFPVRIGGFGLLEHHSLDIITIEGLQIVHRQAGICGHEIRQTFYKPGAIPFSGMELLAAYVFYHAAYRLIQHLPNALAHVLSAQHMTAHLIDHFALLVEHIIVFQNLLADVKVESFHLTLSILDAPCDLPVLDGLIIFPSQTLHDGRDPLGAEHTHQIVFQ